MQGEDSFPALKIITLGAPATGKTCIILKSVFTESQLPDGYTCTLGVDLKVKTMEYEGQLVKFHIWDTAGQERFLQINRLYYRDTHGVVFVFDVTDRRSFEQVRVFWKDFMTHEGNRPVAKLLVGNKIDLQRKVTFTEGEKLALELNIPYLETSAKLGYNIQEIFTKLLETMPIISRGRKSTLKIRKNPEKETSCDC